MFLLLLALGMHVWPFVRPYVVGPYRGEFGGLGEFYVAYCGTVPVIGIALVIALIGASRHATRFSKTILSISLVAPLAWLLWWFVIAQFL